MRLVTKIVYMYYACINIQSKLFGPLPAFTNSLYNKIHFRIAWIHAHVFGPVYSLA